MEYGFKYGITQLFRKINITQLLYQWRFFSGDNSNRRWSWINGEFKQINRGNTYEFEGNGTESRNQSEKTLIYLCGESSHRSKERESMSLITEEDLLSIPNLNLEYVFELYEK